VANDDIEGQVIESTFPLNTCELNGFLMLQDEQFLNNLLKLNA